jgi:hypothetical protein
MHITSQITIRHSIQSIAHNLHEKMKSIPALLIILIIASFLDFITMSEVLYDTGYITHLIYHNIISLIILIPEYNMRLTIRECALPL